VWRELARSARARIERIERERVSEMNEGARARKEESEKAKGRLRVKDEEIDDELEERKRDAGRWKRNCEESRTRGVSVVKGRKEAAGERETEDEGRRAVRDEVRRRRRRIRGSEEGRGRAEGERGKEGERDEERHSESEQGEIERKDESDRGKKGVIEESDESRDEGKTRGASEAMTYDEVRMKASWRRSEKKREVERENDEDMIERRASLDEAESEAGDVAREEQGRSRSHRAEGDEGPKRRESREESAVECRRRATDRKERALKTA